MLVRKKFGGHQSSKCWFEKSSGGQTALPEFENKVRKKFGGKKVRNAGSKKVRGAKLLCQSSKTKFEKSSVEKKVRNAGSKKVRGGPNCSARVRKHSSKKVRWKKKFEMLVRKKFGGPNCLGYLVRKKFDCKEVLQTVVERGSNRGGDFQNSSGTTIPRSRRHIQSVICFFFFEIHHCQRSFGELFLKPALNVF